MSAQPALRTAPFTPETVAGGVERTEVSADAAGVYWLEHDFRNGRSSVMHAPSGGGDTRRVTPEGVDVGTLAWEYGGGSYLLAGAAVVYSDREDQRLYRLEPGGAPRALTPATELARADRYADGSVAPGGRWAAYVRESHRPGRAVEHELVAVRLEAQHAPRVLMRGADFYSSPQVGPDGLQLAWISWSKPRMPWDGTELWLADVRRDGQLANPQRIAGGPRESVLHPAWSPGGVLHWVSDRSGWWNLYSLGAGAAHPLCPEDAEFAGPSWQYGRRSYGFLADGTIVAVRVRDAVHSVVRIDPSARRSIALQPRITWVEGPRVACRAGAVAFIGATPTAGPAVLSLDVASGRATTIAADPPPCEERQISTAVPIAVTAPDGSDVHGFWYAPRAEAASGSGRAPALILNLHGGPTDSARLAMDAELQLWTGQGFGLLDLNYSGSTGFGSAYRHRLDEQWGSRDLADCIAAVDHLVAEGMADPGRIFVRGASAGGYLTLRCLTATDRFSGGMSRCGIADLALWREDAHDFESRYTDVLVGPPSQAARYAERSPARNVGARSAPVLLVHGLADTVVPPRHTEAMVRAYRAAGRPYSLHLLEGEPHGLRRERSRRRWLAAEQDFYSRLLAGTTTHA